MGSCDLPPPGPSIGHRAGACRTLPARCVTACRRGAAVPRRGGDRESTVDARLRRGPGARGRHRCTIEPLPGGLTNRNLKVTTGDGRRVRRPALAPRCVAAGRSTATPSTTTAWPRPRPGVAPGVVDRVVDGPAGSGVLVVDWVDARTWTAADLADERNLRRLAAACRRAARRPAVRPRLRHVRRCSARYLDIVRDRGFRLPPRYEEFLPAVERGRGRARRAARCRRCRATTTCCAANVLDDGDAAVAHRLRVRRQQRPVLRARQHLERGGSGRASCSTSWSRPTSAGSAPALVARARLLGLVSQYGWTLWASIQHAISDARLRLLVLGDGEVRAGRRRVRPARPAPTAG